MVATNKSLASSLAGRMFKIMRHLLNNDQEAEQNEVMGPLAVLLQIEVIGGNSRSVLIARLEPILFKYLHKYLQMNTDNKQTINTDNKKRMNIDIR